MAGGQAHGRPALDGPPWVVANELLAFVIEMGALGALAWWGFATGDGILLSLLLGLGTPAVAIVLWGQFAAPKAKRPPGLPGVLLVKALVLGGGAAALYGLGHPVAAVIAAVVVAGNTAVLEIYRKQAGAAAPNVRR
ncbi:YrdB family protein [Streptomyces sp. N35]|uniref:YrdB family protein n=1 Tax=Streptomyces sp. N35 TaxID=2795730 RepID=UPI0018F7AF0C|nr:YrdB family protein [Streptomyces sp. N35]